MLTDDLITKSRKFAVSEIKKYGSPDITHFKISERKATELVDIFKAKKEIALPGVYLMDLKLGQAMKENKLSKHVSMSVVAAKEFLGSLNIDKKTMNQIIHCVQSHHGTIPFNSIEAEICANADCYRFIHPKGFFLFLTILGKRSLNFEEALNTAENKLDEKYNILSLDICKGELTSVYNNLKAYIKMARVI